MTTDVFDRVASWYCDGVPVQGLTAQERSEVVESAQCSYLAEHVGLEQSGLLALDDKALVATHYRAMVDASR